MDFGYILIQFKEETTITTKLSEIFDNGDTLKNQTKKFLKMLKRCLHKCFKKIKIKKDRETEYEKLYKKWKSLKTKEDTKSKEDAEAMEESLADKYGEDIFKQIKDEIRNIKHDEGGLIQEISGDLKIN